MLLADCSSKSGNDIESEGQINNIELDNSCMQQFVSHLPMLHVADVG